jgi:hypothetical protein
MKIGFGRAPAGLERPTPDVPGPENADGFLDVLAMAVQEGSRERAAPDMASDSKPGAEENHEDNLPDGEGHDLLFVALAPDRAIQRGCRASTKARWRFRAAPSAMPAGRHLCGRSRAAAAGARPVTADRSITANVQTAAGRGGTAKQSAAAGRGGAAA